jgi:NTP pyrophosphatase (non-canonical NTP hydrolase)
MANFKVTLPEDYRKSLVQDIIEIKERQAQVGGLPEYEQFVWNLAKGMATPAEELHHATTGMTGEAAEALDISKKVWIYNKPLDVVHLMEELGDLRFYYQACLNLLQITDETVVAQNMKKLSVRYADGKYSDTQAQARADKVPPLSGHGHKGAGSVEPRKFMGQPPPTTVDQQFETVRDESLRQLRKDEQS